MQKEVSSTGYTELCGEQTSMWTVGNWRGQTERECRIDAPTGMLFPPHVWREKQGANSMHLIPHKGNGLLGLISVWAGPNTKEEQRGAHHKLRPANRTDYLCQKWQSCHFVMKSRQSTEQWKISQLSR